MSFTDQYYLASHKKNVHVGLRNYKCDYCPKAFKISAALRRHVDIHVENYKAQCEICDKKFWEKKKHLNHNFRLLKVRKLEYQPR